MLPRTAYGPEGMAVQEGVLLATTDPTGEPIGKIQCRKPAAPNFHLHSHLAVYVDGALRPLPAGIGMVDPKSKQTETGPDLYGPRCYYELHVHAQDGVIHVEGPVERPYTLGEFFDVFGQPLDTGQVGPARGRVTVHVDGRLQVGDPRSVVLTERRAIQISVGPVVAPVPVDWSHF